MRIYLDNVSVYAVQSAQINTNVSANAGSHQLVVQAWDSSGAIFKTPLRVTVGPTGTGCTPSALGVTVCSPASGATVSSPLHVTAAAKSSLGPISAIQIYVDNILKFTVNAASLDTSLAIGPGTHFLVVQGWDTTGAFYKTPVTVTVGPTPNPTPTPGQLGVSPASMNFGNIAVGTSQSQAGTLSAGGTAITVFSASPSGAGYSLSGITFPVTVPAGQSVPYTVTFAPQASGPSSGSVAFVSNASNSPTGETLNGNGQVPAHSVNLSWNPSTSTVIGYNIYRGTKTGGPYTRLNTSAQAGTSYFDNNVVSGATYFYVVTAVSASSQESAFSGETKAVIPTP
jgi:hypothetical protein